MKQENERDKLFAKIRKHPELLENLSNEQLERLSNFYEKEIEVNNIIIQEKKKRLKNWKKQVNIKRKSKTYTFSFYITKWKLSLMIFYLAVLFVGKKNAPNFGAFFFEGQKIILLIYTYFFH